MSIKLFSSLLTMLVLGLAVKAFFLFNKVEESATYAFNTSANSVLVDTAYDRQIANNKENILQQKPVESYVTNTGHTNNIKDIQTKNNANTSNTASTNVTNTNALDYDNANSNVQISKMYSGAEVKLLKELATRREQIEKQSKELKIREKVLKATEEKVEKKIIELKAVQEKLDIALQAYNDKDHAKIMSLVKIYENMKPKDAAKIFDELDMSVLIKVISNMKELKAAPILASMNPSKARDLSIELSTTRNIDKE